jgi:hypothetical protein
MLSLSTGRAGGKIYRRAGAKGLSFGPPAGLLLKKGKEAMRRLCVSLGALVLLGAGVGCSSVAPYGVSVVSGCDCNGGGDVVAGGGEIGGAGVVMGGDAPALGGASTMVSNLGESSQVMEPLQRMPQGTPTMSQEPPTE